MGKSSMPTFFFIRLQERLFYMLHCRATEVLSIYHALILLTVKYNHLEEHAATDKVNWQQVSEIIPHVKVSSGKTLNPALPPRHPWADVDHKLVECHRKIHGKNVSASGWHSSWERIQWKTVLSVTVYLMMLSL